MFMYFIIGSILNEELLYQTDVKLFYWCTDWEIQGVFTSWRSGLLIQILTEFISPHRVIMHKRYIHNIIASIWKIMYNRINQFQEDISLVEIMNQAELFYSSIILWDVRKYVVSIKTIKICLDLILYLFFYMITMITCIQDHAKGMNGSF